MDVGISQVDDRRSQRIIALLQYLTYLFYESETDSIFEAQIFVFQAKSDLFCSIVTFMARLVGYEFV